LETDIFDDVKEGDEIEVDLSTGIITCGPIEKKAKPIPPFMVELVNAGGLIPYLKKQLEA
jgi:3-isopropylmalate/(R)-2-methylmalate dehydratase small subunit